MAFDYDSLTQDEKDPLYIVGYRCSECGHDCRMIYWTDVYGYQHGSHCHMAPLINVSRLDLKREQVHAA